jgi:transcriptional regulator with XRE-family HTH domain
LSRQSISKWEQGASTPDTDNFLKLSKIYDVPIEALLKGEPIEEAPLEATVKNDKKKRSWIFPAYPVLAVIVYAIIGVSFGSKGWAVGWIVLLTIPLFYTSVIAYEKKKPIIFCYPVLVLIAFLIGGFSAGLWNTLWILFLTIPIFYIITARKK